MVRQMPSVSEPDDKMLDRSNFKVIADDKFRAAAPPPKKKKKKRERNACYHDVLLFSRQCFNGLLYSYMLNPFPDDKIVDWSKLKQIADDI